jgi:hypothetical protein
MRCKKIKMKKMIAAVVIALVLMTAFSGVAFASRNVPPTPETETLTITTEIVCDRKVIESEQLNWESSNKDLLDNPPLASKEKYGKIKYNDNLISSSGDTKFYKDFKIDTGKTPNVVVTKNIGYTAGEKGSLSHAESVDMSLISSGSCVYVSAESSMSVTEVQVATETKAQMTRTPKMHYEINAGGIEGPGTLAEGTISAGMSASVDDKRSSKKPGSELKLGYKTTVDGSFEFYKVMDFKT